MRCFKVSHVLPCLGEGIKTAAMEEEWRIRGVGGQRTKSAEPDYIRFGLSGSMPYKSLPSLKGLHRGE